MMEPTRAEHRQTLCKPAPSIRDNDQNQAQRNEPNETAHPHFQRHESMLPVEVSARASAGSSPASSLASTRTASPPISGSSLALAERPATTAPTTPRHSFHSIYDLGQQYLPDLIPQTAPPFHQGRHARLHHHHHHHHQKQQKHHAYNHQDVQRRLLGSFKPQNSVEAIFSQIAANIAVPHDAFWSTPHQDQNQDAEADVPKHKEEPDVGQAHSDSRVSACFQEERDDQSESASIHSKSSSTVQSADTVSLTDQRLINHLSGAEEAKEKKKKDNLKKVWIGLVQFLRTPLGVAVAIYGVLVVFWGAALVLILMGAVPMSNKQQHLWVEVCSQILNGLFTITGIGLIPWRVRDSYHMSVIASHFQKRRRSESPASSRKDPSTSQAESQGSSQETPLLFDRCLEAFCASQKWFRPYETETHNAFPLRAAAGVCALNDLNSIFQICLCTAMWGWDSHERPPWTTALLIPLSFLCGIGAAVIIWHYGRRRKKLRLEEKREKEHWRRLEQQRKLRRHGPHKLPKKWFFERD